MGEAGRAHMLTRYARPVVTAQYDRARPAIDGGDAHMTRLLVVGGGGMLGHKVWQLARARFETWATVRAITPAMQAVGLGDPARTCVGVDAFRFASVEAALDRVKPDAVVNCVGVIKQLAGAKDPVQSITINALFPHQLARACAARGARLIHISTDCVFDGSRGHRQQTETPDAADLYGRSKALGEVAGAGCLTMRTSIIGRELQGASGLVEWFLSRRGSSADGYRHAVFSGFTTAELANIVFASSSSTRGSRVCIMCRRRPSTSSPCWSCSTRRLARTSA